MGSRGDSTRLVERPSTPASKRADGEARAARLGGLSRGGLVLAALVLMYGPVLAAHIRNSADPLLFNDDARQNVVPFVVPGHASAYSLAYLSIGYQALYRLGALVVDPIALSKVLPYPLLLVVLGGVAIAAGRLGGAAAGFAAVALSLSTGLFLDRIAGGNPRAFAFPCLAGAAVALVAGRAWWLAALVVLSAAFYPPAAVVTGAALALMTLGLPAGDRGDTGDWRLGRRVALVGATALATVLVLSPGLMARDYGPLLVPADAAIYPEAGPGGRHFVGDRAPFDDFWTELRRAAQQTLSSAGPAWSLVLRYRGYVWADSLTLALLGLTALGLGCLAWRESAARRLLVLGVAALVTHTASRLVAPYFYLAQRYVIFPIPILLVIALPVAAGVLPRLVPRLRDRPWARPVATVAVTAACLLLLGGRGDPEVGLTVDLRPGAPILESLARLPEGTLVAGWPGGIIDSVPYVSRRPAFLTFETHQAFHAGYLDELRRRTRALIDAVFAVDPGPLFRLRDEWGVTHLIIDRGHYGASPPTYFKPFDDWTRAAVARGQMAGFEVPRQLLAATVFTEGTLAVLDLRRLAVPAQDAP